MKYFIACKSFDGKPYKREVEGKPIKIKGFEQFDFFIVDNYEITEKITGCRIPLPIDYEYDNEKTVIKKAAMKLKKYGIENFKEALVECPIVENLPEYGEE